MGRLGRFLSCATLIFCLLYTNLISSLFIELPRPAVDSPGTALARRVNRRKDEFTPHPPPFDIVVGGDSYTAAPWAGELLDPDEIEDPKRCYRYDGSYAVQWSRDFSYEGSERYQFIPCTGAKTQDVLDEQIDVINTDPEPDLALFTIGGNDVDFVKIIKACLVHPNQFTTYDCDGTIETARATMNSAEFEQRVHSIYDGFFGKTKVDYHYQVLHITYSRFFSHDTSDHWCDSQSFGYFFWDKPLITQDLRKKLNDLSDDLDDKLSDILGNYIETKNPYTPNHAPGWDYNRLLMIRPDRLFSPLYEGHRFCEPGDHDPDFALDNTWFYGLYGNQHDNTQNPDLDNVVDASYFSQFDPTKCEADPQYQANVSYSWDCDISMSLTLPRVQENLPRIRLYAGDTYLKSFHPKSIGHTAIKDLIDARIDDFRPPEGSLDANSMNCAMPNYALIGESNPPILYSLPTSCPPKTMSASPTSFVPPPSLPTVAPARPPAPPKCPFAPVGKFRDAHAAEMSKAATFFCNQYASATATVGIPAVTQTVISGPIQDSREVLDIARDYTGTVASDDVYVFSISGIDGCVNSPYSFAAPIPGDSQNTCISIMEGAWNNCNNQGRGGSIAAECLIYTIGTKY